jgi:hypothetical protein
MIPEYVPKFMLTTSKRFTSKGEVEVRTHFQTHFPDDEWTFGGALKIHGVSLVRDLYSNKQKICIEYDGIWHFKDIHGQLEKKVSKDNLLRLWCEQHDYRLIRMSEDFYKINKTEAIKCLEEVVFRSDEKFVTLYTSKDRSLIEGFAFSDGMGSSSPPPPNSLISTP